MALPDNHRAPQGDAILLERKKRILSLKTAAFLLLSVFLVYFLLRKLDIAETAAMIKNADIALIIASCFTYFLSNFFKSLRIRVILRDDRIPLFDIYTITSYHNFFNQVLPARTGELTFVYYLKKISAVDISKGLHILVVIRIFDFIVISAIFICSVILYFGAKTSPLLIILGALFFLISIITLFNLKWLVIWSGKLFHLITGRLLLQKKPLVAKIMEKIDMVVEEFSSFKAGPLIPMLAVTSLLIWCALYLLFYLTIRSFGIDIGIIQSVVGSTGGVLTNVLPINSFGSFGTLEAGWTGGFMLVGMSEHDAIFTGFGYHIISFFTSGFIALVCLTVKRLKAKV
jgi:uncharacterized protein (TIRG00374 family)